MTLVWSLLENYRKPYDGNSANRRWKAEVEVLGAELQPCLDIFPRQAPATGYKPKIVLDLNSPKPPDWLSHHVGGRFYIKSAQGYGLLELNMVAGFIDAEVTYLHNPTASRNLEINPKLVKRWFGP